MGDVDVTDDRPVLEALDSSKPLVVSPHLGDEIDDAWTARVRAVLASLTLG